MPTRLCSRGPVQCTRIIILMMSALFGERLRVVKNGQGTASLEIHVKKKQVLALDSGGRDHKFPSKIYAVPHEEVWV